MGPISKLLYRRNEVFGFISKISSYKKGKVPQFRELFLGPKIDFRILELFRLKELELKRPKMIPESILYPYYRVGVNFLGENTVKRPFLGSSQHRSSLQPL